MRDVCCLRGQAIAICATRRGGGDTSQGKSIQLPRQLVIRISMTPVLCAACRCVLPLEGKEPENYESLSLCRGKLAQSFAFYAVL